VRQNENTARVTTVASTTIKATSSVIAKKPSLEQARIHRKRYAISCIKAQKEF